jgi:hypothetical protein
VKREMAKYMREKPVALKQGRWQYETITSTVRVMARAEGYAMVRHKGAMPFVVSERDLHPLDATASGE